jgi:endonuclease I
MKLSNSLFFSAALIAIVGSTSCTKEYTCQCKIKYSGVAGMPDSTINEYQIRDAKKTAKSICEGNSATYEKDNVKTVETCQLF